MLLIGHKLNKVKFLSGLFNFTVHIWKHISTFWEYKYRPNWSMLGFNLFFHMPLLYKF
jgi:hypothetical protein